MSVTAAYAQQRVASDVQLVPDPFKSEYNPLDVSSLGGALA